MAAVSLIRGDEEVYGTFKTSADTSKFKIINKYGYFSG